MSHNFNPRKLIAVFWTLAIGTFCTVVFININEFLRERQFPRIETFEAGKRIVFTGAAYREISRLQKLLSEAKNELYDHKYWPAIDYFVSQDAKEDGDGSRENPMQYQVAQTNFWFKTNQSFRIHFAPGVYKIAEGGTMTAGEGSQYVHLSKP